MSISATLFFSTVSGLIRLGKAGHSAYQQRLLDDDIEMLLPPAVPLNEYDRIKAATDDIRFNAPELLEPGQDFHGLFVREGSALVADDTRQDLIDQALIRFGDLQIDAATPAQIDEINIPLSPIIVLEHKAWLGEKSGYRRARLGRSLASLALNLISAQPDMLGLNRRATALVGGLAASLDSLIAADDAPGEDAPESFGERLAKTFFHSTLQTVAERTDLFVPEERWIPVVSGLVEPLQAHFGTEGTPGQTFALQRLAKVMRGPVAHGVLTALNTDADAFLTSDFADDTILGAVTRSVLGEIVSADQGTFDLLTTFTPKGAVMIYGAALDVAQKRPELFIDGDGLSHDTQRQFLSRIAQTLDPATAPRPYSLKGPLGAKIACLSMEIAGEYASAKLRTDGDGTPWSNAGLDAADMIINQLVTGMSHIIGSDTEPQNSGAKNPIEQLFTADQAMDILRSLATHIAQTPSMLTGDDANPEVSNIAKGLAHVFAHQTAGLMDGDDWNLLVSTAMGLAAANPGTLFSIDETAGPESHVAVTLIATVLDCAAANMADGRQAGAILFGKTLRDAIIATVQAATGNLFAPSTADAGDTATTRLEHHAAALRQFIDELIALANSDDRAYRMSAEEWLYVYRYFVAHIVAQGAAALTPTDTETDAEHAVITREWILNVLHERQDMANA